MQNCLPPNTLEGYKELDASSVVSIGVQSTLLGAIFAIQEEQAIAKKARHMKDWRQSCKSREKMVEVAKGKQQELAAEVASLSAELTRTLEL